MIIALSGFKGSGKDEGAKILIGEYGFRRVAFADVLKDLVADMYGVERSAMDDPARKEKPILSLPVSPKDKFSEHMLTIQWNELRDKDGKAAEAYKDGTQLYHTPRSLCILIGSVNRFVNPNYWVERALNDVRGNIVITDLRYRNEDAQVRAIADGVKKNFQHVRVSRFDTCPSTDPSERDLDGFDFDKVIQNRGTLEDFQREIRSLADELLGIG